jgi:FtsZ-interacting cell division protein ZipA
VINLVSLLIAPLVVKYADDNVVRIAIGAVALVILAVAIWYSKSRRSELMVEAPAASDPATAARP